MEEKSKLSKDTIKKLFSLSGIFWVLLLFIAISAIISPTFTQGANIVNLIRQVSMNGLIAISMTYVIITGGIDLSVGAIVGMVVVVAGSMLKVELPVVWVILAGIGTGLLCGAINGVGIVMGNIPPFIMTLGTLTAIRGAAYIYTDGWNIMLADTSSKDVFGWLGTGNVAGIPVATFVFVAVFIIGHIVLKYTSFGRGIYAIGDNREAARLSGINIKKVVFSTYVINGFLAALCGLIYLSRLNMASPLEGNGFELDAISMVFIGGTSSYGGEGSLVGTFFGMVIVALMSNILNLTGVTPYVQQVIKGAIVILAVLIDRLKKKRRKIYVK